MGLKQALPPKDEGPWLYPWLDTPEPLDPDRPFAIILPTTKRFYYWELKPFFALFNKYWGEDQEVVVLGDAKPSASFPNMAYFDMPDHLLIENGHWIMHMFSTGLRWYFREHLDDNWFIMLQTDFWMTAPVQLERLRTIRSYMEENPDVIRVGICPWPGSATNNPYLEPHGRKGDVTFYRCNAQTPHCFLQMSNIPAMWNRDLLHEVWVDGHDGWACEQWGSNRLVHEFPHLRSVVAKPPAFFWDHVSYTRFEKVVVSRLPLEDRELVRSFVPSHFKVE